MQQEFPSCKSLLQFLQFRPQIAKIDGYGVNDRYTVPLPWKNATLADFSDLGAPLPGDQHRHPMWLGSRPPSPGPVSIS